MIKLIGEAIKVKDLWEGAILFEETPLSKEKGHYDIVGIAKVNIPDSYLNKYCKKVVGNRHDYLLIENDIELPF